MEDEYGRPWPHHVPDTNGPCVTYADHLAAVAAAEQRVRDELPPNGADALWYLLGQRKGVQAARAAVAAMEIAVVGNSAATVEQALAAIDAINEGKYLI